MLIKAKQILLYPIVEGNPTNRSYRKEEKLPSTLLPGSLDLPNPSVGCATLSIDKHAAPSAVGSAPNTTARKTTTAVRSTLQLRWQQLTPTTAQLREETALTPEMGTK